MREVEPKVYPIAMTVPVAQGMDDYFKDLDVQPEIDTSNPESVTTFAGKLCYRSWEPYDEQKQKGTNPNVSRIRSDHKEYIGNVLKSGHGSVLEHTSVSLLFANVSRVFTHEIVRHRAGMAYSQESLRYVRLNHLDMRVPNVIKENTQANSMFRYIANLLEDAQTALAKEIYKLDEVKDFHFKKTVTSALRRIAPIGLCTNILVTGNIRAWRHIIQLRSGEGAEEEVRDVMNQVVDVLTAYYPTLFQDLNYNEETGEYYFSNEKV